MHGAPFVQFNMSTQHWQLYTKTPSTPQLGHEVHAEHCQYACGVLVKQWYRCARE